MEIGKKIAGKVLNEVKKVTGVGVGGNNSTKPKSKFKYTPFRNSADRLSINKNTEKIYTDNGTIYWTSPREQDTPRWSHYYDTEKEQIITNWYGNTITSAEVEDSEQVQRLLKYPNLSPASNTKGKADKTIQPNKNVYANQNHAQHDAFRSDVESAIQRNGMNSVGMINDTKRKEIIDGYALNKPDNVKPFLTKGRGESQSKYEENASKRYEDRYKDNPKHLPKKKIPDYTSGPSIKYDEYNKLYTLDENTADLKTEFQTWKKWDFVPFILHDIANKKYLPFRSYINSISDQSDSEWQQVRYIGRADSVQVYAGFTRIVSLDFTTVCFSLKELHPMWQRLNYLVGLTKPSGYTSENPNSNEIAMPDHSSFIIPPFLKFNLGDMYKEQPVVMTSVALTIPPEASWELTSDTENKENQYEYLNGTFTTKKEEEILVGQYPNMAQVSISFTFLEKRLPKTGNRHFGHWLSEDNTTASGPKIDDDQGIPEFGFNYNLIHPDPSNEARKEIEKEEGTEPVEDPDPEASEPDIFEGFNSPECTTYPPSKYYRSKSSGNLKSKEATRIESELKEWEECACNQMAKMMGQGDADNVPSEEEDTGTRNFSLADSMANERGGNTCIWDEKCITKVNGKEVPPSLKCVYTKEFEEEPEEEDEEKQPPKCPYPIGGLNETDEDGRIIGYSDAEKKDIEEKNPATISRLKKRNLEYWIKDVSDFLANKMGQGKIGNGPYSYVDYYGKADPPLSKIRKATSKNKSITLEFDDNGNPSNYARWSVPSEYKTDFKIDCDKDDIQEIREIAGHQQPLIYVDTSKPFKIRLDTTNTNAITNENFENVEEVKKLLADFVSKRMNDTITDARQIGTIPLKKYNDLTNEVFKDTIVENDEIYYAPYEEDRDLMVKAHKVFPGTSEYVNYEVSKDVADKYKIHGESFAELKIGFYAIVSKTKRKISGGSADKGMENEFGDYLFDFLWKLNGQTFSGGRVTETQGAGGDGTQSDEEKAEVFGQTHSQNVNEHLEDEEQRLVKEKAMAEQFNDVNVPVLEYEPIGDWSASEKEIITTRMRDMKYQQLIYDAWGGGTSQGGSTRLQLENYIFLIDDPTDPNASDIAKIKYNDKVKFNELTKISPDHRNYRDQQELEESIAFLKKLQQRNELDQRRDGSMVSQIAGTKPSPFPLGFYFDSKTSHPNHFVPWVKDHVLQKIEFVDDGANAAAPTKQNSIVPAPKPKTETPTSNVTPTWTWLPIEDATLYEVYFKGDKVVSSKTSFRPEKKLKPGLHTIEVKAGVPNKSGTGTDWSTVGIHEVKIDKKSLPPKPPTCPYKVGEQYEEDKHGRLIGWEPEDPFSPDIQKQVDDALPKAIENNIKMWAGDVMAYIMANEGMGEVTYPSDPAKVTWTTDGTYATTIYEQNQMKWMISSKTILSLGANGETKGFPLKLNGKDLGAKYYEDFDMACGPHEGKSKRGDESTGDPNEPLDKPNPHSKTPTNNSRPTWKWMAISGANKYKVTLQKKKLNNSSINPGWITDIDYGIVQYNEKTEVTISSKDDGIYEIAVTAEETESDTVKRSSEVGTHIVEIEKGSLTTPTPKSNEGCEDYPKPYELFLSSSEWCAINKTGISFTRKLKVKNQWKKEVGLYLACKQGIDVSTLQYNYTVFNDDGRIVKVIFDGKEIIVENDEENTFFLNKGTALPKGDEREAYINMQYIPDWNPNDLYESKMVKDPKLSNCPGEEAYIPNKVFHNGILYVAQTSISDGVLPGHRPDDVNDRTLPDNLMSSPQKNLKGYNENSELVKKYYKRWWLTESEDQIVNVEHDVSQGIQ